MLESELISKHWLVWHGLTLHFDDNHFLQSGASMLKYHTSSTQGGPWRMCQTLQTLNTRPPTFLIHLIGQCITWKTCTTEKNIVKEKVLFMNTRTVYVSRKVYGILALSIRNTWGEGSLSPAYICSQCWQQMPSQWMKQVFSRSFINCLYTPSVLSV